MLIAESWLFHIYNIVISYTTRKHFSHLKRMIAKNNLHFKNNYINCIKMVKMATNDTMR